MPESKTTEILCVTEQKWVQGPRLPVDLGFATCAALPPTSNFACVIVGCSLSEKSFLYVYGLDKNLSEWTLLGRIKNRKILSHCNTNFIAWNYLPCIIVICFL